MSSLTFAILTHPGLRRPKNEDAVGHTLTPWGGIFVVADGMGGHKTGEVASRLAVETILQNLKGREPSPKALVEALEEANRLIYQQAQWADRRGMGTTVTALVLDPPYALIGHVGDSRAYLFRHGVLKQLTEDHSWVAERVRQGILSPEEARVHRWRNVITNALGSFPEARVDLLGLSLEPKDTLLLCTDGLYGVLEDRVLARVLKAFPPEEAVQRLIALANEWGGPDNISVGVIRLPERLPEKVRPYALPLLYAAGEPVKLQLGKVPEELPTQVVEPLSQSAEPPKGQGGLRRTNLWLFLLWILVVVYILLNALKGP